MKPLSLSLQESQTPQEVRIDQNLTIVDVRRENDSSRIIYKFTSSFSTLGKYYSD